MISTDSVKNLYLKGQVMRTKEEDINQPFIVQFFRGVPGYSWKNQHPGSCQRHSYVFRTHNVIPSYCFSCYKVLIQPRTVVELFQLMVVFKSLKLPDDNTRKCSVEVIDGASGTYKGFVYCRGLKEARKILQKIQRTISIQISKDIPVTLKRGCTPFSNKYPEYGRVGNANGKAMKYREEWRQEEIKADKNFKVNSRNSNYTHNSDNYTLDDAQAMYYWLRYAATIGDLSYLEISDCKLQPLDGVNRPTFKPVENS